MEAKKEFMLAAIQAAKDSAKHDEYAIGAVVVKDNKIISIGEVRRKRDQDPIAHAEIVAIKNACKALNSRSLKDCIIYSTQECCPMCTSAIIWAKMKGIVFGAFSADAKSRATEKFSWRQIDIPCKEILSKSSPKLELIEGFMRDESLQITNTSQ
jgi:guanine deaminase